MTKSLIFFSGGADSTYVLYKLLTETDDEITTCCLQRENYDSPYTFAPVKETFLHLPKLLEELRKIRDFKHIYKTVNEDEVTPDTNHAYTFFINYAAPSINDGTYDRIVSGRTREQHDRVYKVGENKYIHGMPSAIAAERFFKKVCNRGELFNPLLDDVWFKGYNRWHAYTQMPKNLAPLINSCDYVKVCDDGQTILPCKECWKCLWDEMVFDFIAKGHGPEYMDYYRKLKSIEYGGSTGIYAEMRGWVPIEMGRGRYFRDIKTKEDLIRRTKNNIHSRIPENASKEIWDYSDVAFDGDELQRKTNEFIESFKLWSNDPNNK
jgi:hypothetical protein